MLDSAAIPRNIILCGFMGSGKTAAGQRLAEELGMAAVDVDHVIESEAGMSIPEIFREKGEAEFRDIEHEAIKRLAGMERVVLCPGGGALAYERNALLLRDKGVIFFLNPGFDECYSRIKDSDRPLVRANTREQLEEMYRAREVLYRKAAHFEICASGGVECWAEAIIRSLKMNGNIVKPL